MDARRDAKEPSGTATVIVVGGRVFRREWGEALNDACVELELLSSYGELERHLSARSSPRVDLLIVEGRALRGLPEDASALQAHRVAPLRILIAELVTPDDVEWLGKSDRMVLPPPSDEMARRLLANHLLGLRAGLRPGAPDREPQVATLQQGVSVDLTARLLLIKNNKLMLTRGEARILRFLLCHPERWCTTAEIRSEVFQRSDRAGLDLVWKYVSTLRAKLGARHGLLQQSRTFGYRIAVDEELFRPWSSSGLAARD